MQEKQAPNDGCSETDHVDVVRRQWARERPELDTGPIGIIARLGRAQAYIDPALDSVFAEYGLTRGPWDVLAALRRAGAPYRLTPTELYRALMRTSGAITHTLHRLEYTGLVERLTNPADARSLYVALTPRGVALTDTVAPLHLDNERCTPGRTHPRRATHARPPAAQAPAEPRTRPADARPPAGPPRGQAARAPQGIGPVVERRLQPVTPVARGCIPSTGGRSDLFRIDPGCRSTDDTSGPCVPDAPDALARCHSPSRLTQLDGCHRVSSNR